MEAELWFGPDDGHHRCDASGEKAIAFSTAMFPFPAVTFDAPFQPCRQNRFVLIHSHLGPGWQGYEPG
jgi:hypothetical protein